MHYHSDIITNIFGEPEKKKIYDLGELVCTYLQSKNKYVYALIIEVDNRTWVRETVFKRLYTLYLHEGREGVTNKVIRYQPDIYLAQAIDRLNETHMQLKFNRYNC